MPGLPNELLLSVNQRGPWRSITLHGIEPPFSYIVKLFFTARGVWLKTIT
jgi:hypothetical protein